MKIISIIYSHPEFYPPLLNAIDELSEKSESITILCRNVFKSDYPYPKNVRLIALGSFIPIRKVEQSFIFLKLFWFLRFFIAAMWLGFRNNKKDTLFIGNDVMGSAIGICLKRLGFKGKVFYYCHDIMDVSFQSRYSIIRWAKRKENSHKNEIDLLIIPNRERARILNREISNPMPFIVVPNYPTDRHFYNFKKEYLSNIKNRFLADKLLISDKMVVRSGGLILIEETMEAAALLDHSIKFIVLTNLISPDIKIKLTKKIHQLSLQNRFFFLENLNSSDFYGATACADIGLALYDDKNVNNQNMATAGNKLYLYVKYQIPVITSNQADFKEILSQNAIGVAVDGNSPSEIANGIKQILSQPSLYSDVSFLFEKQWNYKTGFSKIMGQIDLMSTSKNNFNTFPKAERNA